MGDPADKKEALMREYAKDVLGHPFGALGKKEIVISVFRNQIVFKLNGKLVHLTPGCIGDTSTH